MLSFDGWSVGIAYCLKIILDSTFSILVAFKAKKHNIKLLYFPVISQFSVALAFIPLAADFFHILFTGYNIQFFDLYLIPITILLLIDAFFFICLGVNLTFSVRKKFTILFVLVYITIHIIIVFFSPNMGYSQYYPTNPGETPIKLYFSFTSINLYLLIPYAILLLIFGIQLLLKSMKMKGKIKLKFQMLAAGYFFGIFWMTLVFTSQKVGILYAIFFVGSLFVIWITFYYGLTPVREKKPKKKRSPTEVQQKFVSYLMKKPASNQAIEGESLVSSKLDKDILVFVSYSTKDSKIYKIQDIAEQLKSYPGIKDVLFYEGKSIDNIIKYMNDNLGECDAFLLFSSENALSSVPVEKEWTAAEAMGIPIIPIFYDLKHVPPLLQSRLGIDYDFYNLDQTVKEIYSTIIKKCIEAR